MKWAQIPVTMVSLFVPALAGASTDWSIGLQELDLSTMRPGWGAPQVDKSVTGSPISIGGRKFVWAQAHMRSGHFTSISTVRPIGLAVRSSERRSRSQLWRSRETQRTEFWSA